MRLLDPKPMPAPKSPDRPSEFHKTVEERTQTEAGPVEYPTSPDQPYDEPSDYGPVEHGETDRHLQPAEVVVVEPVPSARQFTDWSPSTLGLSNVPTQIGDASRRRTRLVVRNLDIADPVYLARASVDVQMGAFTLPAGEEIIIEHNAQVWAFCDAGKNTVVTYFTEYTIDDVDD